MASLISRGLGVIVRSAVGLPFASTTRCRSLLSSVSSIQCSGVRWFSKTHIPDDHPKRPLTAYFRYTVQQQPILRKKFPEAKIVEITKMIAIEWNGLSDSAKEPYKAAAKAEQQKYSEELKKYKENLSPVELEALRVERINKLKKRRHIRKKRELTSLGKPKRPRSDFNIFMSEHFHEKKGISTTAKLKSLRDDWENLNDSQKQAYIQLAQDDKIRYDNEMKSWEEHMMEIGRDDLIRSAKKQRAPRRRAGRPQTKASVKKTSKERLKSSEIEGKTKRKSTLQREE
ncbi:transcription factor A, mitochondrial [Spea bombifrons]|uniref:transcription factor A, mitochondrial n=1 Tax=Spea bombifrons TaxID=233779 RepID=UPI00234BA8D8|nr:transcription factor A, mitochondrial [Spea bombifrons]